MIGISGRRGASSASFPPPTFSKHRTIYPDNTVPLSQDSRGRELRVRAGGQGGGQPSLQPEDREGGGAGQGAAGDPGRETGHTLVPGPRHRGLRGPEDGPGAG